MGDHPADDQVHPVRQTESVAPRLDQIAALDEVREQPLENRPLLARQLQRLQQLPGGCRVVELVANQLRAAARGSTSSPILKGGGQKQHSPRCVYSNRPCVSESRDCVTATVPSSGHRPGPRAPRAGWRPRRVWRAGRAKPQGRLPGGAGLRRLAGRGRRRGPGGLRHRVQETGHVPRGSAVPDLAAVDHLAKGHRSAQERHALGAPHRLAAARRRRRGRIRLHGPDTGGRADLRKTRSSTKNCSGMSRGS